MEDFLAKFYLAIVFGVLLVSALFLGYQIQLTQQLENNLDKFRTKKTSEKDSYQNLFKLGQLYLRKKIYNKAIDAGASGGKLLGAGAGGFILFYVKKEKRNNFFKAFDKRKYIEFGFESKGSQIIKI